MERNLSFTSVNTQSKDVFNIIYFIRKDAGLNHCRLERLTNVFKTEMIKRLTNIFNTEVMMETIRINTLYK